MNARHPWMLVGPWYRWPASGGTAAGRASRPEIQKFASSNFVNDFLKEPQRSLVWTDDDHVHRVVEGVVSRFRLSNKVLQKTDTRKLFLDTHGRFYLVVCALHCDMPGFPAASRDQVCEAGFVVRRHVPVVTPAAHKTVETAVGDLAAAKAKMAQLGCGPAGDGVFDKAVNGSRAKQQARLAEAVAEAESGLRVLTRQGLLTLEEQGWVPNPDAPGIGAWQAVAQQPQAIVEEIHPLYPLIPDPADRRHSAAGHTLWFGVLPTGTSDADAAGNPKLDDRTLYEARCFVRRHKEGCPKTTGRNDCKGELVWSRATEPYRLAAPFDLTGTSNRPVTVQLPDLPALEAQAAGMPFGEGIGVRMVSPPGSGLDFEVDGDGNPQKKGGGGGAAICGFSIPLITIVAYFVLRLFLPIVVFVFGLWFMLRLKFCIPPSFSLDADLAVELKADLDVGLDIGAGVQAKLDAGEIVTIGGQVINSLADFEDVLLDQFDQLHPEMKAGLDADLDLNQIGALAFEMTTDFSASVPPDLADDMDKPDPPAPVSGTLPSLSAKYEYYERREVRVK